jgi:hypothetical protein
MIPAPPMPAPPKPQQAPGRINDDGLEPTAIVPLPPVTTEAEE